MTESDYLFISKGPSVLRGDEAKQALEAVNDSEFYVSGQGIPKVSRQRWEKAQDAESTHWFGDGSKAPFIGDDRNLLHFERFGRYRVLNGLEFKHALEIGSGPFTNMRLVAGALGSLAKVSLLDPGLESYLKHPGTYFNQASLAKVGASKVLPKVWPFLPTAAKNHWLRNPKKSVKIESLHAQVAEGFDGGQKFDLVVMANVLEHCFDASAVLEALFSSVSRGGVIILSEKTHLDESVFAGLRKIYDVAHPIRVTKASIEARLTDFQVLFHTAFPDPVSTYLPGTEECYWIAKRV